MVRRDDPGAATATRLPFSRHVTNPEQSEAALRAAYDEHASALVRYAAGVLADADRAADIVLEVFWAAWQRRHELDPFPPSTAYWFRAVKNRALNAQAKDRTRDTAHSHWGREHDMVVDPERRDDEARCQHAEHMLLDRVADAVAQLPPRSREVLLLQREHGLSYREIAEVLGISELTVKTHVARALRTLRAIVTDDRATIAERHSGTPEQSGRVYSDSPVRRSLEHERIASASIRLRSVVLDR